MDPAIAMLGADMVQLLKLAFSKGGGLHSRAQEDSIVTGSVRDMASKKRPENENG